MGEKVIKERRSPREERGRMGTGVIITTGRAFSTAAGRSTTNARGCAAAYAVILSSHVALSGEDAGTFWRTTSNGCPVCVDEEGGRKTT